MQKIRRVVHLVSFLAIMFAVLSPLVSQSVLANRPTSNVPASTLGSGNLQATPVHNDSGDNQPPINEPSGQTPISPRPPVLTYATCGEGVEYAQIATAPKVEGLEYVIGDPDATGLFTISAIITDSDS